MPTFDSRSVGYAALWVTFAISGLVYVEPAPFDLAIVLLAALYFLAGLRIPRDITPLIGLLFLMLLGGALGAILSDVPRESLMHLAITGYLCMAGIFIACLVRREEGPAFTIVMGGMTLGAIAAAVAGLVGYFGLFDGAGDLFTLYGRAKGTFKDPNVFAPFLVPPALFCIHRILTGTRGQAACSLLALMLLAAALLLSFSRGAWANFVIAGLGYVVLMLMTRCDARFRLRLAVWSVIMAGTGACLLALAFNIESIARPLIERARLIQDYDSGGHGRFDGQVEALALIVVSPLGIGARDFARLWGEEAHNVYLTGFLANGWLGGFAYLALVVITAARGLTSAFRPGPLQGGAIVLVSSFVGLAIEGLIVDTDHWRHFYILTGMIWGIDVWSRRAAVEPPVVQRPSTLSTQVGSTARPKS